MEEQEQPRHPALPRRKPQVTKPKVTAESLLEAAPWQPAPYEIADVTALQALVRGDASPDMQKRAIDWIIRSACGTYDFAYRPNSERDTSLALGRQFAGQQIVKLLRLNPAGLRRSEPNADPPEPA